MVWVLFYISNMPGEERWRVLELEPTRAVGHRLKKVNRRAGEGWRGREGEIDEGAIVIVAVVDVLCDVDRQSKQCQHRRDYVPLQPLQQPQ